MRCKLFVRPILALLLALSIFNQSCVTGDKVKRIDEFMTYCYENDLYNGTVLIAQDGKVIYKNAFGYSNLETKEALKLNTPSCIGSVSKQFTAMAIMILKEQDKLDYDDKLADYFPEIPGADKISVRHLLNHTSGTLRYVNLQELRVDGIIKDNLTNQEVFEALVKRDSLNFEPGEKYSYTNSGFILLAMIVEKVSGEPFHEFMKKNIFDPLEMENTFVWNKSGSEIQHKAIGYNLYGEKSDYNVWVAGAGGIYSTVDDLFKWDQSLYKEKLVSQNTLNEAFTPGLLNNGNPSRTLSDSTWGYGFGWLLRKNDTEKIVWHDGGFNGFSAIFYRELNGADCIILLSNKGSSGTNAPVYPVRNVLLNIINDESYELPQIPITMKMRDMIENNSLEEAIHEYHELKNTHADKYDFSENQLNALGYYYLNKQKFHEAKSIFRLNIQMFPKSSNVYDSYGEVCMLNGDYDEAINNYKLSLELNPDNANAVEMLKKINKK